MKKLLLVATLASLLASTNAMAGWWGSATVETVEFSGSLGIIKGKMVSTNAPYACNLSGDGTADSQKGLLALALTAKSTGKTVNLNAVNTPTGCNLWGLRIEI